MTAFLKQWPSFRTNLFFEIDTSDNKKRRQWMNEVMDVFSTDRLNIPLTTGAIKVMGIYDDLQISFSISSDSDWHIINALTTAMANLFEGSVTRQRYDEKTEHESP